VLEERREEEAEHAVEVRRGRAHGDQRVHGRRAVLQGRPGGGVELPPHPELHDAGQPPEEVAVVHPGGQEREPVRLHRAQEDEDAEGEADRDLALERAVGGGAGGLFGLRRRLGRLLAGARRRLDDVVAGAAHRVHQVLAGRLAGEVGDGGLLGGEVDLGPEDAGRRAQGLLHPAHAARAGHAEDGQRLLCGHDPVARVLDRGDDVAGEHGVRVEGHGRPLGRQVHGHLVDAGDLAQGALRPCHAARAGHARDGQLDGGLTLAHCPVSLRARRADGARGGAAASPGRRGRVLPVMFPEPNDTPYD